MIAPGAISPFNRYVAGVGGAGITDDIYFDSDPLYTDDALITNRGTNGIDGTAYSAHVVDFDGSTGYVDTGQTLAVNNTTTPFAIEAWINIDAIGITYSIYSNYAFGSSSGLRFSKTSDNNIRLQLIQTDAKQLRADSTTEITELNKWVHVKATYDGSDSSNGISFFINGIEEVATINKTDTADTNANISSSVTGRIGVFGDSSTAYFNGQIFNPSITINGTLAHSWEMMEGKESLIFDSVQAVAGVLTGGAVWVTGLSGLENGETHNGLPQNLTRKWNAYPKFNGSDNYVIGNASHFDPSADGQTIAFAFIRAEETTTINRRLFGYRTTSAGNFVVINDEGSVIAGNRKLKLQVRGSTGTVCQAEISNIPDGALVTGTATINGASDSGTLVTNYGSASLDASFGTISSQTNLYIGAAEIDTGPNGFINFPVGFVNVNGNLYSYTNNWNGNGLEGAAISEVSKPIPEDVNNLGFDIGGNAITPSGDTFRADGLSDIDANVVSTLDYNSDIQIVAENINIYESQAVNTIFSTRDATANERGILAYLDASDKPVLLLQRDTTTRVQVESDVAISAGDKVAWKSNVGDASGVTIEINDVAVATTTLQDQDISGGITSAVNAQWFVDKAGTANKFKGTATIIKVL